MYLCSFFPLGQVISQIMERSGSENGITNPLDRRRNVLPAEGSAPASAAVENAYSRLPSLTQLQARNAPQSLLTTPSRFLPRPTAEVGKRRHCSLPGARPHELAHASGMPATSSQLTADGYLDLSNGRRSFECAGKGDVQPWGPTAPSHYPVAQGGAQQECRETQPPPFKRSQSSALPLRGEGGCGSGSPAMLYGGTPHTASNTPGTVHYGTPAGGVRGRFSAERGFAISEASAAVAAGEVLLGSPGLLGPVLSSLISAHMVQGGAASTPTHTHMVGASFTPQHHLAPQPTRSQMPGGVGIGGGSIQSPSSLAASRLGGSSGGTTGMRCDSSTYGAAHGPDSAEYFPRAFSGAMSAPSQGGGGLSSSMSMTMHHSTGQEVATHDEINDHSVHGRAAATAATAAAAAAATSYSDLQSPQVVTRRCASAPLVKRRGSNILVGWGAQPYLESHAEAGPPSSWGGADPVAASQGSSCMMGPVPPYQQLSGFEDPGNNVMDDSIAQFLDLIEDESNDVLQFLS